MFHKYVPSLSSTALLLSALSFVTASGGPVRKTHQTMTCCGVMKIHINNSCENTISVNGESRAHVEGDDVKLSKQPGFKYLPHEGAVQVLDCKDFTHRTICYEGNNVKSDEEVSYHLGPCPKGAPDAAAVRFDPSVLLIVALLTLRFL